MLYFFNSKIAKGWVLLAQITLWIYIGIVKPIPNHGALEWWQAADTKTYLIGLQSLFIYVVRYTSGH